MNTPQEFAPLLAGLRRLEAAGFAGGGALATLTRTRGSTFRRAGARMLVCGDGHIVRGLSGGCPERDIVARAHRVIATGQAEIVRYNRDYGLDAMVEMGCGGELEVLIEPLSGREDLLFVDAVANCLDARREGFLATAFTQGGLCLSQPRRLVWSGAVTSDDLGDAALSEAVIVRGQLAGHAPAIETIETTAGRYEVLIERLRPPHALLLVGVTAGALALARFAQTLGWDVTLVDHDMDAPPPAELPPTVRLLRAGPDKLLQYLRADRHSSAVVMTHNLERDAAYLRVLGTLPLAYLGAIGSRSRAAKLSAASGLAPPRLRAPAGLDLGSETPEEIALAIAAEILAVIAGRSGGVLSAHDGPIH